MILPERVFGRSSVRTMECGRAILPILLATCSRSSLISTLSPWTPAFSVTKATMASPTIGSGRETTADSATAGWSTRADSIS